MMHRSIRPTQTCSTHAAESTHFHGKAFAHGLASVLCISAASLTMSERSEAATAATALATQHSDARTRSPAATQLHRIASSKSFAIVAKVGDLVITNHQVDARSALLLQGSRDVGTYFKNNIQKRWKSLASSDSFRAKLTEYVRGKQPTSQKEAQKYAKQYAMSAQKRLAKKVRGEAISRAKKSIRKKALDDLIDERLKLYEAKRLNVLISDEKAKEVFSEVAKRNKKTVKEFEAQLRKGGVSPGTLRDKIKADHSWRQVIQKQFGFQLHMMQSNLERYIGQTSTGQSSEAMLEVQKLVLASPGGAADLAGNLKQADALRTTINGCGSLASAATTVPGSRVEKIGQRKSSEISEPMRTLLMNAAPGELIPPQIGSGGSVELWVLCSRKAATDGGAPGRRQPSAIDTQRQKEFQILARRHLNDLRREVHIEYR